MRRDGDLIGLIPPGSMAAPEAGEVRAWGRFDVSGLIEAAGDGGGDGGGGASSSPALESGRRAPGRRVRRPMISTPSAW